MAEYQGLQPTNNSIMHGTSLALMVFAVFQFFNSQERQTIHKKNGGKKLVAKV